MNWCDEHNLKMLPNGNCIGDKTVIDLRYFARQNNITVPTRLRKADLRKNILAVMWMREKA